MYNKQKEENAHVLTLFDECRERLNYKKIKWVDNNDIIKTLRYNFTEQTNTF